ncbi:MAG: hypothetical protein R3C17_12605 [Planctomycetaceae bacterium]
MLSGTFRARIREVRGTFWVRLHLAGYGASKLLRSRHVQTLLVHSHLHDIDIMVRPPTLERLPACTAIWKTALAGLMIPREHG